MLTKIPKQVNESAQEAGVSPDTIRRDVDAGKLKAIRTASGQRLIDPDDLARYIRERGK